LNPFGESAREHQENQATETGDERNYPQKNEGIDKIIGENPVFAQIFGDKCADSPRRKENTQNNESHSNEKKRPIFHYFRIHESSINCLT